VFEINKTYCEDCSDTLDRMPDDFLDLTVTSPPYDSLRGYNGYHWGFDLLKLQLFKKTKPGGVLVWVVADSTVNGSESGSSFKQALGIMEAGFNLHDTMIYQKVNPPPYNHRRYQQAFDYMFVFSKGRPKTFNPIMVDCKNPGEIQEYSTRMRRQFGVHHINRERYEPLFKATKDNKIHPNIFPYHLGGRKSGHPAAFPDQLAADHITTWSNPGDLVYDPPSPWSLKRSLLCSGRNNDQF